MIHSPFSASTLRARLSRAGLPLTLAAGLLLGLAASSFAQAPHLKPRPPFLPPYDAIQSVDATAKTLVVGHVNSKDTSTKTYKLVPTTEIQVNGDKAKLEDLKTGMKVSVTPAMDATVAERVVASPSPAPPPATPAPGKPAHH